MAVCEEAKKLDSPVTIIGIPSLRERLPHWVGLVDPSILRKTSEVVGFSKLALCQMTKEYADKIGAFYFNQLGNPAHIEVYESIARECVNELPHIDM
jgi:hypothetical protein